MVNDLADTLVVEAAGCIVVIRTESSIVTRGRILSIIKGFMANTVCCPVLLGNEFFKM